MKLRRDILEDKKLIRDHFRDHGRRRNFSPPTMELVETVVNHFDRAVSAHLGDVHLQTELHHLNDENLGVFVQWCRHRGMKDDTARMYTNYLYSFWNRMAKLGKVPPPQDEKPSFTVEEHCVEAFTWDELLAIVKIIQSYDGEIEGMSGSDYFLAIFMLLAMNGGERTGALFAIRTEWLDLEKKILYVPGSVRKGGTKAMYYPLKDEVFGALMKIYDPEREYLFPCSCKPRGRVETLRQILMRGGFSRKKTRKLFQKFRRSFATHVKRLGGDPSAHLRHGNAQMTSKFYIDQSIARPDVLGEVLPPIRL